jgi:heme/copper-type cytochrome/quinol oxidase subunit 2
VTFDGLLDSLLLGVVVCLLLTLTWSEAQWASAKKDKAKKARAKRRIIWSLVGLVAISLTFSILLVIVNSVEDHHRRHPDPGCLNKFC